MLDRIVLQDFEKYTKNNDSFCHTYFKDNDSSKTMIIVSKYPYTNFEMKVLDNRWSNHIKFACNSLSPFDCWNLINEFLS